MGCQRLRSGHRTKDLASARQFSLRGADALQQNKWNDAEVLFAEALRQSDVDERAQWGQAEVLWNRGEKEKATEHMLKAVELSGENPELLVRLGQMYAEQGTWELAQQQADRVLTCQRTNAGAWELRGDVLRQGGQLDLAMDSYHRSLIYRPGNPRVQISLAEIYRSQGRPQRALATLDHLADQRSGTGLSARSWLLKGQALADLGESSESMSCLRNAAILAQDDEPELLLQIAGSQFTLGELGEARICLGRVLRHNPQNDQALHLQNQLDQSFHTISQSDKLSAIPVGFDKRAD